MAYQESYTDYGGGGGDYFSGGGGGYYAPTYSAPAPQSTMSSTPLATSFDVSSAGLAAAEARGNTRADVLSAYQTYLSGVPTGRGGGYAVDAARRFNLGSIREGAAAYLRAAGLPELAQVVIEEEPPPPVGPAPGQQQMRRDPLETLADLFEQTFQVFKPQEGEQQFSVIPQVLGETGGQGGGLNITLLLGVAALVGVGIYFYTRRAG